jgi:hypothetical protein
MIVAMTLFVSLESVRSRFEFNALMLVPSWDYILTGAKQYIDGLVNFMLNPRPSNTKTNPSQLVLSGSSRNIYRVIFGE